MPVTIKAIPKITSIFIPKGSNKDAFGRLRISQPQTLFDSKYLFDNQALFWDDQEISGAGTTESFYGTLVWNEAS